MSDPVADLDAAMRALGEVPAPPPSPDLLAMVGRAERVEGRRPLRSFEAVLFGSLVVLAIHLHSNGLRRDLGAIPKWWFFAMIGAWAAAFVVPLGVALVPRRGSMFVDARSARLVALAVPAVALVLDLLLRIDAPPQTVIPPPAEALGVIEGCIVTGLEMAAIPFMLGVFFLLRAPQPLESRWIGAALGAGNGALTGLMLHIHCWFGGALHTGVAHAGHSVIGAVVGALLVPALAARHRTFG